LFQGGREEDRAEQPIQGIRTDAGSSEPAMDPTVFAAPNDPTEAPGSPCI
jgi:hypothetical protein